jgi:hypothetical protein
MWVLVSLGGISSAVRQPSELTSPFSEAGNNVKVKAELSLCVRHNSEIFFFGIIDFFSVS